MSASLLFSETWTFFEGSWFEGNHPIMGPRTHAAWLGSTVFDGARIFAGLAPDLRRHFERINHSATSVGLEPKICIDDWIDLTVAGVDRFEPQAELYVRPMYWPELGMGGGGVKYDPKSTRWCLCLYRAPLPSSSALSITLSPFRRPSPDSAPTDAKAGCLYPNGARALLEAQKRGFDNCVMNDALGHVAELANSNLFLAKDGIVYTPVPNGTFLNGITRQRVIKLLRGANYPVCEATLRYQDFLSADEIFATGNFAKVVPIVRIETRALEIGPVCQTARDLYWRFAATQPLADLRPALIA